jgi:WhiB family redox-sensing transcriptional regulator
VAAIDPVPVPDQPPRYTQQTWMHDAACRGRTDLYFAPPGERPQARVRREARARSLCLGCPVLAECRWYARRHREFGFWGGESEDERGAAGYPVRAPLGGRARRSLMLHTSP